MEMPWDSYSALMDYRWTTDGRYNLTKWSSGYWLKFLVQPTDLQHATKLWKSVWKQFTETWMEFIAVRWNSLFDDTVIRTSGNTNEAQEK